MPVSLPALESQRAELLREISQLGDLRPGSITATRGTCGNPKCHCHRPQDPGHGPNWRLTYKAKGKTVTETFPTPAAMRKAEREIAEFRKYQQFSRAFLQVNEKICRLRPVAEEAAEFLSPQEKKQPQRSARKLRGK